LTNNNFLLYFYNGEIIHKFVKGTVIKKTFYDFGIYFIISTLSF